MADPTPRLVKVELLKIGNLLDLAGDPYVKQNIDQHPHPMVRHDALVQLEQTYAEVLDVEQDTAGSIKIKWRRDPPLNELRFPIGHEVLVMPE